MKSHNVSKDPVSIRPTTGTAGVGHRFDDGLTNPVGSASTYRSREKGREEWGLPPREALRSLARTYLEQQAVHWPGLLGTAAVPEVAEATIDAMAAAFERRFRTQLIDAFEPAGVPARWRSLGGAYTRFSDEGSNPRSLNQQLVNILARARRDDVFIPWAYVCGDAAISGTLACRRGYLLLKTIVEQRSKTQVEWLVIDELSRTNRNVIESLRLNELVRRADVVTCCHSASLALRRRFATGFHRVQIALGPAEHDLVDGGSPVVEGQPELGHVQRFLRQLTEIHPNELPLVRGFERDDGEGAPIRVPQP